MIVLTDAAEYSGSGTVAALGMFDGVHIGHQSLIRTAVREAKRLGLDSVVCTFDRNPMEVLCPARAPRRIFALEENLKRFEQLGADYAFVSRFTEDYASMEPEAYVRSLCDQLRARVIVSGENYSFGRLGKGNASLLKELSEVYGYTALIVPPVLDETGVMVSSTRIRAMLAEGETDRAEALLKIE